jgi:hypothetical protein
MPEDGKAVVGYSAWEDDKALGLLIPEPKFLLLWQMLLPYVLTELPQLLAIGWERDGPATVGKASVTLIEL